MPTSNDNNQTKEINLRELFLRYINKWYWFLISITICVGVMVLHILSSTSFFEVTSTFAIRQNEKSSKSMQMNVLSMMGIGAEKLVSDELEVYTSKTAFEQAIRDLNLQTEYRKKKDMRWIGQYPNPDVVVTFPPMFCDTLQHKVEMDLVRQKSGYKLSVDMQIGYKHIKSKHAVLSLNEPIQTCIGTIELHENTPLKVGDKIHIKTLPIPVLVDSYHASITAKQVKKESNVIRVTTTTDMPQRGIALINRLTELYNFDAIIDKNMMASNAKEFIEERLAIIETELDSAEIEVEKYKRENAITNLSEEAKIYLKSADEYQKELVKTETQLNLTAYIRDFLSNEENTHKLIPTNLGLSDEGLVSLTETYNELVLRQMRMQRSATESNPMLSQLDDQIDAMRANLLASIGTVREALLITKNNLLRQQEQFSSRIKNIPEQERTYIALRRQQEIKQSVYIFLFEKREENALTLASTTMPAKVIDKPRAATNPVSPKVKILLLFAFLLGCCIPVGITELWLIFDNKIRSRKEYQQRIKAPFIGQLSVNTGKQAIALSDNTDTPLAELFRLLRGNIRFMLQNKKKDEGCVILVTSSINGEGKSFVAINTALSFALLNKRVALVGLDIRKPMLAHYCNLNNKGCLTSYLASDEYQVEDTIIHSAVNSHLDIIPAGIVPPNPNELLQSKRLDEFFDYLRAHYDYILVDSAPVGMVSDTFLLSRVADITLYVSRADYTPKDMTEFINSVYEEKRLPNMACVLNSVKSAKAGYGYGYGYGYGGKK